MYKLESASVFYGPSRYPLNGLPQKYDEIDSIDSVNADELTSVVGRLTGFPRLFEIRLHQRQEFTKQEHGFDLVVGEAVIAHANGYSIIWRKK